MASGFHISSHGANTPALHSAPMPALKLFGEDGLTFRDVFDLINPLHHVPLVGNLYRRLTGDVIDPAIRIAGGALFGGPLGAGFAAASVAFKHALEFGHKPAADGPAPAASPSDARGGWMVAAARTEVARQAANPAVTDQPVPVRRGGWMAQAAYAMADARAQADLAASLHDRIDTTA